MNKKKHIENIISYNQEWCINKKYFMNQKEYPLYIPSINLYNKNILLKFVKNDGTSIQYIPKELLDYDICLEAVKQNIEALKMIPKNFINDKIIEIIRKEEYKNKPFYIVNI